MLQSFLTFLFYVFFLLFSPLFPSLYQFVNFTRIFGATVPWKNEFINSLIKLCSFFYSASILHAAPRFFLLQKEGEEKKLKNLFYFFKKIRGRKIFAYRKLKEMKKFKAAKVKLRERGVSECVWLRESSLLVLLELLKNLWMLISSSSSFFSCFIWSQTWLTMNHKLAVKFESVSVVI